MQEEKFIDSLQNRGHIYCNTVEYFRKIEDGNKRGDKYDSYDYLIQGNSLKLKLKGSTIATSNQARLFLHNTKKKGNIYCFSRVKFKGKGKIKVFDMSPEFVKMGKYALLITNPDEFISRIESALKKLNLTYKFSLVSYYDESTYHGGLGPFSKRNCFSWQNEVRLWIDNNNEEPFEFFIGNISDISYKFDISQVKFY